MADSSLFPQETTARIKVVGIGGGGCNAVTRMVNAGLRGVEFIGMNTDLQALSSCASPIKLNIGAKLTKGLGAGANPDVGRRAVEESRNDIEAQLSGGDMIFITSGMGGGTGTGGAPLIASISKGLGALTVSIVTKPFRFEGRRRTQQAEKGIQELREQVDTLIVIPNDKLLTLAKEQTTVEEAFLMADEVLRQGVNGITELILAPGLINLDFADVKAIMENSGNALVGLGESSGEDRATRAVQLAISSPLLESSIDGAKGVLINFMGGTDLSLQEVNRAATIVYELVDPEANIIFGTSLNDALQDRVKVMILATGFEGHKKAEVNRWQRPEDLSAQAVRNRKITLITEDKQQLRPEPASLLTDEELDIPAFLRRKKTT